MNTLFSRVLIFMSLTILVCSSCKPKTADYGADIYKPDTTFKVVGYLSSGSFNKINDLELNKLTYLDLAFGNPDKDGNLVMSDNADITAVVNKAHEAGLKVFVSLAGGGRPDTIIWKQYLQPKNRSFFVKNILDFVVKNNLDGVDVDIEGNLLPWIGKLYNPFVVELKNALHSRGKGMSSALGAVDIHEAISQEALDAYDFINVMVYDKTGIWMPGVIGPHSPYSYAEDAIKFWTVDKKIPARRITLGVPFYGFDFTPPARYIDYREIIKQDPMNAYRDSVDMKYYNGIPMIARKAELSKKLGGIMIWEISCDSIGSDLSLLRALDQTLKAGNLPVTAYYKDEDGDGFGNPAKPFCACNAPQGYVSNRDDANDTNKKIH